MTELAIKNGFSFKKGYQPGLLGWLGMMHGQNYVERWNFGKFFECRVTKELSSFLESYNSEDSEIWTLMKDHKIYGSITIDGSHAEQDGAHLRWFMMHDKARGHGLGRFLLEHAIQFAKDHNYPSIYLWTLEDLEPAGSLYRSFGFEVEENFSGDQWGQKVQEEKLRLIL